MVQTPYHIHTSEALGRCPWKEFRTFIPAFKHVGSVVRGKQLFAAIRCPSGEISSLREPQGREPVEPGAD